MVQLSILAYTRLGGREMTKLAQGTVHGKTIELTEDLGLAEGHVERRPDRVEE